MNTIPSWHSLAINAVNPLHSWKAHGPRRDRKNIQALADETRLRIFEAISVTSHMNCGEIVSMRGRTPATVSHHLRILSDAGLIACRRGAVCLQRGRA